jgi:hypothetical protein
MKKTTGIILYKAVYLIRKCLSSNILDLHNLFTYGNTTPHRGMKEIIPFNNGVCVCVCV